MGNKEENFEQLINDSLSANSYSSNELYESSKLKLEKLIKNENKSSFSFLSVKKSLFLASFLAVFISVSAFYSPFQKQNKDRNDISSINEEIDSLSSEIEFQIGSLDADRDYPSIDFE